MILVGRDRQGTNPDAVPSDDRGGSPAVHRLDLFAGALAVTAALPLLVAVVYVLVKYGGTYQSNTDNALNEVVLRELGERILLLGPYSRGLWSHPGPMFYYVMWIPYRIFGSDSTAFMVGALLLNAASIGVSVLLAHRWGGRRFAVIAMVGFSWLVIRLPIGFLWNPWNPFITVLPFGLFLLCVWAAVNGDRFALPLGAVVGTFCVQTHVQYAAPFAVVFGATLAFVLFRRRLPAPDGRPIGATSVLLSIVILALLWLPPAVEQLIHAPGNISNTLSYLDHGGATKGMLGGYRAVAAQFTLRPEWLFGLRHVVVMSQEPTALGAPQYPILLVVVMLAFVASLRRSLAVIRNLFVVLAGTVALSVPVLSRTVGEMFEYRLRWLWVVAMLLGCAVVWRVSLIVRVRVPRKVARAALAVTIVVLAIGGTTTIVAADPPSLDTARVVDRMAAQIMERVPRGRTEIELAATSFATHGDIPGLMLRLGRAGYRVRAERTSDNRLRYGDERLTKGIPERRLTIVGDEDIEDAEGLPDREEVAFVSTGTRSQRAMARRKIAAMQASHHNGVRGEASRFRNLNHALGGRAVFLSSPRNLMLFPPPPANAMRARHRILFYGDGLAVEASGDLVQAVDQHVGWNIQVHAMGYRAACDWLAVLPEDLHVLRPSVVAMLSAGDSGPTACMKGDAGEAIPMGSPTYDEKYRSALSEIFRRVTQSGARVVYFLPPPFTDPVREQAAQHIALIAEKLSLHYPGVTVSAAVRAALSQGGRYAETLPCLAGETALYGCRAGRIAVRTQPGRIDTGLHLCPVGLRNNALSTCAVYASGATRFARAVAAAIVPSGR